ncbi:MAG: YeeE/YedE thiosulfate transporter family protein [Fidelibacterota bacterium]
MKKLFDQKGEWHWFTGGIIVSVIAMASYVLFQNLAYKNYAFGMTAGFGYIATVFKIPFGNLTDNPIIQKYSTSPAAFVEFFMLIGIAIGGFTAAKLNHNYAPEAMPAVWKKYHGDKLWKRYLTVLIGGFMLGWGAVFASGCTTGNILNGWAHLSPGSIVAGTCFFIGGMITAKLLYPKTGGGK